MNRQRLSILFFSALLFFFLYEGARLLAPFSGPLMGALATAIVCYPMHHWVRRKLKRVNKTIQALISDLAVLLFIVVPIGIIAASLVGEIQTSLPEIRSNGGHWVESARGVFAGSGLHLSFLPAPIERQINERSEQIKTQLSSMGDELLGSAAEIATGTAKNVARFTFDILLFLFILFFLFRDGDYYYRRWNELLPMSTASKDRIHQRLRATVEGVVRGAVVIGLLQGVIMTTGYLIVGARAAILLGATTVIASVIPGIGSALLWIPIAIYYFLVGATWKGILLISFGAATGVVDNIVRPLVVGSKTEMSFFWLTFALMGGIEVFGVRGLILGPLIFAVIPTLLDIYQSAVQDNTFAQPQIEE